MASTRDLRRRIRSIKNTSQITKAMQMVSATKMRKAQNQAISGRPYSQTLSSVLSQVFSGGTLPSHPLLQPNNNTKVGVVLFSSDKGLCGALNTNLFRLIQSSEKLKGKEIVFYTLGKKGRDFVVRTGRVLEADFENPERVGFSIAIKINKYILTSFLKKEVGEVYLLYSDFISTLKQEPKFIKVLPIDPVILASVTRPESDPPRRMTTDEAKITEGGDYLFEPDMSALLDFALTHVVDTQIFKALLETKASEHSARMIAMQNATNNAKDLVSELTLTYNQMRQESITRELLEITSAGAALE